MLAGPLDYHHGGMRNELPEDDHPRDVAAPVQGTRGQQLAMYIVYQDHLPMMADYPSAYRKAPELGFLVDIPTTWDETRVLHAEPGRCLVIARRRGDVCYIGGMTAAEPRTLDLPLTILGDGSFRRGRVSRRRIARADSRCQKRANGLGGGDAAGSDATGGGIRGAAGAGEPMIA
jgi:alpha-glucosidase